MQIREMTPDDLERVLELRALAFNISRTSERATRDLVPSLHRVAEDAGRVVGVLRILPFEHWWGGRTVPAAGIASVAVAGDARGKGVGTLIMRETLRELRANGTAVSSLYPATAVLYKRVGYGFGGIRTFWQARLSDLARNSSLTVEEFGDDDLDQIAACYSAVCATSAGLVARDEAWWRKRVLTSSDGAPYYRFCVREHGRITGYVIYRTQETKDDWRFTMECRDLHWTTPSAARALLSLAALHRSTAVKLTWAGPPTEPLVDLMPEDVADIEGRFRWMLRLLDVPAALEARGYHRGVEARVSIAVRDPIFQENSGPWRVEVADGEAKVAPGGPAEATADAETWATIWSGLHSASDEARMGRLEASADAVAALDAMFAGPLPWLCDFF